MPRKTHGRRPRCEHGSSGVRWSGCGVCVGRSVRATRIVAADRDELGLDEAHVLNAACLYVGIPAVTDHDGKPIKPPREAIERARRTLEEKRGEVLDVTG